MATNANPREAAALHAAEASRLADLATEALRLNVMADAGIFAAAAQAHAQAANAITSAYYFQNDDGYLI